ncbi:hypothetical protein [Longimicrobium terrae]|uniref:Outer membrane protein beta-barrel domain-containing protein n=1 Tax=Longimicrobium terrae TaxID=1639882 RepID=A0A841H0Y3_9BACT|nr:hypothetical protein [Longimicrobium terrae]MBB4637265.1 hypothetical protein [Longimicrobium terrae]MBB6071663.1 hypothetical protein [Longimicrobium terrae]NNC28424.1 hypothetical protein [Longimicrobium terrae]
MKRLVSSAIVAALALCTGAAHAQSSPADADTTTVLRKGARSISFTAPLDGGSAQAGIWRMVDDNTNVGILVALGASRNSLDVDDDEGSSTNTQLNLSLGVRVRRYADPLGPVRPYILSGAYVFGIHQSHGPGDDLGTTSRVVGVGGLGGLGVEWFPARRVSISGETGLRAQLSRQTLETDDSVNERTAHSTGLNLDTFTSGLAVQIYF